MIKNLKILKIINQFLQSFEYNEVKEHSFQLIIYIQYQLNFTTLIILSYYNCIDKLLIDEIFKHYMIGKIIILTQAFYSLFIKRCKAWLYLHMIIEVISSFYKYFIIKSTFHDLSHLLFLAFSLRYLGNH